MSAVTLIAYFLLSAGPGLAFFGVFIAPRSLLVLLSLFSTFLWLTVLLLTAALFRGFLPIGENTWSYGGMLMASVIAQESVRYGVWILHKYKVQVWRITAALYQSESVASLTGGGTFYPDTCPHVSFFLVGALSALAFSMILPSIMVIALDGYNSGNRLNIAFAPAVHVTAALVSLGNLRQGGCLYVLPVLLVMGIGSVGMAAALCWQKGVQSSPVRARLVAGPVP